MNPILENKPGGAAQIRVAHLLPGRARLIVPGLKGNRAMAEHISQKLAEISGICQIKASPLTGRLLVVFNESEVELNNIINAISDLNSRQENTVATHRHMNKTIPASGKNVPEPEDLPVKRQLFNVALGGGVLAYLGLKHLLVGRTPLAKHPHIFNLAALTAILSGYPLLRSGSQSLAKGRINHDLVMSALAIGTILARESIPGLLVIWLTNLTALGQSLVLKGYHRALPELPQQKKNWRETQKPATPGWSKAGLEYGRKAALPVLGMASLLGLTGKAGGFQRTLAMLLAANPSPAGLAAPTAATAAMVKAGRKEILYRDTRALELLAEVDTIILTGPVVQPEAHYQVGDILTAPGISKRRLFNEAVQATAGEDYLLQKLRKVPVSQEFHKATYEQLKRTAQVLVGDRKTLDNAGIDTSWGRFKARRLQHLGQIPVFVALQGRLAGLIGIKPMDNRGIRELVSDLRAQGLCVCLALNRDSSNIKQICHELGIQRVWADLSTPEKLEQIKELRRQGHKIAVVLADTGDIPLLQEADAGICLAPGLKDHYGDVIITHPALLPEVFRLAIRGKQRAGQNLALVQAAGAAGLALGAAGWLSPMAANVYNNLISVAVSANSFRLLSGNSRPGQEQTDVLGAARQETAATTACAAGYKSSPAQEVTGQTTCLNWHNLSVDEALRQLGSDIQKGLGQNEALRRIKLAGANKIAEAKPPSFFSRFLGQMKDFLVKALIGSAAVCLLIGEFTDALAIVTILVLNAVLGALQEHKAEGDLQALNQMTAPSAKVRREGTVQTIPADGLVPGDIVLLEQGDRVPADLRLLETHNLEIEESVLTGESYPVPKDANSIEDCIPLLDCANLAFMGTNITRGRAVGLVIATGMSTEMGKIAGMLNQRERKPTPLQNRMAAMGGEILKYCLAASGLLVLAGILRGGSPTQLFLTGVCLAVAAIPEGLPAVVTIAMASGVRRMAKENAVVRRLPAVETLGSATTICTDKTGTLTQNSQQIQCVYTGNSWWRVPPGMQQFKPEHPGEADHKDLVALLTAGLLCNNANLRWSQNRAPEGGKPRWVVEGDPTEGALLLAALREDLNYAKGRETWERVREIPFDSDRLRMTVVCRHQDKGYAAFVKGAPEIVTGLCRKMQVHGNTLALDETSRQVVLDAARRMTGEAMRVLAIAYRPMEDPDTADPEQSLVLLGLVGMVDPPREEVRTAIETCHRAGIKVVMITGDHPHTALAIAQKAGITNNSRVLTGRDLDRLSDIELAGAVDDVRVFARVLPAHKLRLVKAFRRRGEILAMVGDGINDAPAVKEADIGVAMGQTGTDVTKQASDIVLTDDNFATLVSAIEQGRGIYSNIRRSVRYLLSTNVGLVAMVFLAVVLGLPMPLLPIHLLFVNILGDGLPALALGVEQPGQDLMSKPPRPANQSLLADGLCTQIVSRGTSIGLVGLGVYALALRQGNLVRARTMAMSSFMASKLLSALECSDGKKDRHNRYLFGSVALSTALLAGAMYLPLGNRILKTSPLGLADMATVLGASGLTCVTDRMVTGLLKSMAPDTLKKEEGNSKVIRNQNRTAEGPGY